MKDVVIPKELVAELQYISFTSYNSEEDSCGFFPCCNVASYEEHKANCAFGKLLDLISKGAE